MAPLINRDRNRKRKRGKPQTPDPEDVARKEAFNADVSSFVASTPPDIQRAAYAQIYRLFSYDMMMRKRMMSCIRDHHPGLLPWREKNAFVGPAGFFVDRRTDEQELLKALEVATADWIGAAFQTLKLMPNTYEYRGEEILGVLRDHAPKHGEVKEDGQDPVTNQMIQTFLREVDAFRSAPEKQRWSALRQIYALPGFCEDRRKDIVRWSYTGTKPLP